MKTISLLLLLLGFAATSCTRSSEPVTTSPPPQPGTPPMVFRFDYMAVQEALISKSDPLSGDRWSARFKHLSPGADNWQIESGPDGAPLLDRKANGTMIEHLLDTLRTIQIDGVAPEGPEESFGLKPPHFALRWKADNTEFEIRFGATTPDGKTYAMIPQQGHGKGSSKVLMVHGAAQRMLAYIDSFKALRFPTWSPVTTDDVDEFEVKKDGQSRLYAQREADHWVDRKRRPFPPKGPAARDIQAILDELNHGRIEEYVDSPERAGKLRAGILAKPLYEAILTDRQGKAIRLHLARADGRLWGVVSSRPDAVFALYPKATDPFEKAVK